MSYKTKAQPDTDSIDFITSSLLRHKKNKYYLPYSKQFHAMSEDEQYNPKL